MEIWDRGKGHYTNATTNENAQHAHTSTPTRINCPSGNEIKNLEANKPTYYSANKGVLRKTSIC